MAPEISFRHICCLFILVTTQVLRLQAFMKLVPIASKVEFKSNINSIDVSHEFLQQSPTNQTVNLVVNITSPIKDMKLHFSYYSVGENGSVQNVIMKRLVDACFFIRHPGSDRAVKMMYDYVQERSNLPRRCPIPTGHYYIRNLRPRDVPMPPFLHEMSFMLEINIRSEVRRETMLEFRFYGKLIRLVENMFAI